MFDWHYLLAVPVFLLMITVLVAAHEYGHYLFARLFRMEVEEFAIGIGLPKWRYMRKNGTDYTIRAFPVGGFVRIKGMAPQEDGSEVDIPNGFYSRSPAKRLMVLFAGPLFSVLAGMVMLVGLYTMIGEHVKTALLGQMIPDGPAAKAGLKSGDLVLSVDGKNVSTWEQMQNLIRPNPGRDITLRIERDGSVLTEHVRSKPSDQPVPLVDSRGIPTGKTEYVGIIGVYAPMQVEKVQFWTAVQDAYSTPITLVAGLVSIFHVHSNFTEMMGGPGTIAVATADATKAGPYQVVLLAAMLSISVGILNLLPFYPLDGGQMLEALIAMLKLGRRVNMAIQSGVRMVGVALVGALVLSVLWVDVTRFTRGDDTGKQPPPKMFQPAK